MTQKIELWFPTPIYFIDNLFGSEYENVKELFYNHNYDTRRNDYFNVDSSYDNKTHKSLHKIEKFKPVFEKIEEHVYNFAKECGYTGHLNLNTSWANKSLKNDFLYPHVHSDCLISGAYYVKAEEEDKIQFTRNINDMKPLPNEMNLLNQRSIEYPCKSDRLILFYSDTLHMTLKQKAEEKMTLSFNYKY